MRPDYEAGVHLDTFDSDLAEAVVAVLRRHGIKAWTKETGDSLPGLSRGQLAVLVPADSRDLAFSTLGAAMDEVHAEAAQTPRLVRPRGMGSPRSPIEDEDGAPIVMERIRRMGFVAFLLAPLLVITLAAPGMPMGLAVAIYIAGLVALTAWRKRETEDRD